MAEVLQDFEFVMKLEIVFANFCDFAPDEQELGIRLRITRRKENRTPSAAAESVARRSIQDDRAPKFGGVPVSSFELLGTDYVSVRSGAATVDTTAMTVNV